jgi:hypothetical protein
MEMILDAVRDKVFITTTYCSRDNAIKHFSNRHKLSSMFPKVKTQPSPDERVYPVVVHDAKAMIESLLYSPLMDNEDNLLFPNAENPLAGPPPMSDILADVDTGKAYLRAHNLLYPIIYYVASFCTLIRLLPIAMVISRLNRCTSLSQCSIVRHATNHKLGDH